MPLNKPIEYESSEDYRKHCRTMEQLVGGNCPMLSEERIRELRREYAAKYQLDKFAQPFWCDMERAVMTTFAIVLGEAEPGEDFW